MPFIVTLPSSKPAMANSPALKVSGSPSILILTSLRRQLTPVPSGACVLRRSSSLRLRCIRSAMSPLLQDFAATAAVMSGAYSLVLSFDSLTKRNIIEQNQVYNLVEFSLEFNASFHVASFWFYCRDCAQRSETLFCILNQLSPWPNPLYLCVSVLVGDIILHLLSVIANSWYSTRSAWKICRNQSLSRKVVHVLSGVLFMSSWPIFSSSVEARYFAALVPLFNCLRLVSYGLCLVSDEGLIKSITRDGKPEELLRGPLYYVLVLLFCTLFFWRETPIGIVSLAMMSGGDGFADVVGRRFGTVKLPYNKQKSWIGSIAMFIFGFLFSIGMLYYFSIFGYIHFEWRQVIEKVAIISFVATTVESLPLSEFIDDNISVPLSSILTAFLVFGH